MTIDAQLALGLVAALAGGVAWLVRLEARISRAEERHKDLRDELRTLKTAHYDLANTFREAFGGQFKITKLPERRHDSD